MRSIRVILLSFIVLSILRTQSIAQEATKEYTIKKGDTLWDISQRELKDSFLWPKLWRENPEIKNPDRIYPDSVLKIPVKTTVEEKRPEPVEKVAVPPEEEKMLEKVEAPKETPKVPLSDKSRLASAGYITPREIDKSEIVDSPDKKTLLGEMDIVYLTLSSDMKIGDRFAVLRIVKKVIHPKTGVFMGNLVKILGELIIIDINEQTATGKIIDSFDYITRGDRLESYAEIEIPYIPSDRVSSPVGIKGYIVEVMDKKVSNAQMDIVYLDKGLTDGLNAGYRFKVVAVGNKTTVPSTGREINLPDQIIGEVQILSIQENFSAALITKSVKDIKRGDMIQSF
ncbi:MAG: LysM peptidoglycan-binding domain-containing protein [Nitrospirae bacterium]|nr:LysM peptidoglycan-binding domain-containing protein [Nitrospirota bacterium]